MTAVGMRQNTMAIKRSNVRHVTGEHVRALNVAAADEALADIMIRGWGNLDQLSPVERYRFDLMAYGWLAAAEQAFADYESGQFPEDAMVIFHNNIPGVMSSSEGGLRWWRERRVWFNTRFRENVERLLAAPNSEAVAAGVNPRMPSA